MRFAILSALLVVSSLTFAAAETPQEKAARLLEYSHVYNKTGGQHLFLMRSTLNPAILASYVVDGLDSLGKSAEYLSASLDLKGVDKESAKKAWLDLNEKKTAFYAFYNMLKEWSNAGFPGMEVKPENSDTFNEYQEQSGKSLEYVTSTAVGIERRL